MRRILKFASSLAVAGLCFTAMAGTPQDRADYLKEQTGGRVDDMVTLPTGALQIMNTERGLVAMTSNGRFAVQGALYDTWQMKELRSIKDVRYAATHIDTDSIDLDLSELSPLTFGAKELPQVTAFIDPACKQCASLLRQMKQLSPRYHFNVVLIGIETPQSGPLVPRLICAGRKTAVDALMTRDFSRLPKQVPAACDLDGARRALIVSRVFNVTQTPFLIAPDGQVRDTAPDSLTNWLNEHAL